MIFEVESNRFIREVIEKNEYAFLFKHLVVIDVGCNIGTFSFWIHDLAKQIYAIDIVPENIASVNKTIADNKIDNIKTYRLGIAGHKGDRKYIKDSVLGGGASMITDTIIHEDDPLVPCLTVNEFMDQEEIKYADVLKIDIEGLELEVLGAADFPKDRINTIIGEIHSDGRGGRFEVKDILEGMGYRYIEISNNHFLARKI